WSDKALEGAARFLDRVWRLVHAHHEHAGVTATAYGPRAVDIRRAAHKTLMRVTADVERLSFNTAIARIMELYNVVSPIEPDGDDERAAIAEAIRIIAVCLSPFAPHLAEAITAVHGG